MGNLDNNVISRAEALNLGLSTYFTGASCSRGHVSERYVSTYGCVECVSLSGKLKRERRKDLSIDEFSKYLHYDESTGHIHRILKNKKLSRPLITKSEDGYISINLNYRTYTAHRLVYLIKGIDPSEKQVDHLNGDRSDNRWSNLRLVDSAENNKNRSLSTRNTSGLIGISMENGKWLAMIGTGGKKIRLGLFDKKEKAIEARKLAEKKYGFHRNHGRLHTAKIAHA